MSERIRVIIIDDEAPIRKFLKAGLGAEGVEFFEAENGEEGVQLVAQKNPDVVLLDLGLPDMDGHQVLARIRDWSRVPVIVLSARGQERDKVTALDGGADDYLTKPFSVAELMARIRVSLRHSRSDAPADSVFETGPLRIDFSARRVTLDSDEVRLTQIEYRLLALLARHAGKVVTQRHILAEVWGAGYEDSSHTLRVHMANLRQKIEPTGIAHRLIRTETGVGYRLLG